MILFFQINEEIKERFQRKNCQLNAKLQLSNEGEEVDLKEPAASSRVLVVGRIAYRPRMRSEELRTRM